MRLLPSNAVLWHCRSSAGSLSCILHSRSPHLRSACVTAAFARGLIRGALTPPFERARTFRCRRRSTTASSAHIRKVRPSACMCAHAHASCYPPRWTCKPKALARPPLTPLHPHHFYRYRCRHLCNVRQESAGHITVQDERQVIARCTTGTRTNGQLPCKY
jgi:hypothetical protein